MQQSLSTSMHFTTATTTRLQFSYVPSTPSPFVTHVHTISINLSFKVEQVEDFDDLGMENDVGDEIFLHRFFLKP